MKRMLWVSFSLAALYPMVAAAGALYGTARQGAAPLSSARLLVACPGFAAPRASAEATSDNGGSYSMRIASSGRCEMRVERGGQAGPAFEVYVTDNPMRYDFSVDAGLARAR